MNYSKLITAQFEEQDIDLDIEEIPIAIYFKSGDLISLSFIERETVDALVVSETTTKLNPNNTLQFGDELRIIPKDNIDYVSVIYDVSFDLDNEVKDKMFL